MKKIITIIMALCSMSAMADGLSDKIISDMAKKIKSLGDYCVDFTVETAAGDAEGIYVVSGNRFYVSVGDNEIISDGKVAYDIDKAQKEIMIDNVKRDMRNVMSDPTTIFDFTGKGITGTYTGEYRWGGWVCDTVSLDFGDNYNDVEYAVVMVDKGSSLPVKLRFKMKGVSQEVVLTADKIVSVGKADEALFTFDRSKYSGYEIVDFR